MRIGINAQALTSKMPCGINTYVSNLIKAFTQLEHKHDIMLFSSENIHFEGEGFQKKVGNSWGAFSYFRFSKMLRQYNCDVAFVPKETVPFFFNKPVAITVYDLFFIKMYKKFKKQIKLSSKIHYEIARINSFKKADALCAISESCRQDLIEFCGINPDKIIVTYLAYDPQYFFPRSNDQINEILKKYQIKHPYFLNVSSVFFDRKNVMGVLRSFKLLQEAGYTCELIMNGKIGPSYKQMQDYIHTHKLKVKCLNSLSVEELALLLSGAKALVFPSFDEGFGLPIIEAMAVGCPVITSNISAMPEVAGGAAHLVDPNHSEDIFEAMKRILEDSVFTSDLKEKGLQRAKHFSWLKTAQKTLDILDRFQ